MVFTKRSYNPAQYFIAALVFFSLAISAMPSFSEQSNPDPANIKPSQGGNSTTVTPHNDARDFSNLQWAFDNTNPGGKIILDEGIFFLGDGKKSPRRTVIMRKGLTVTGKKTAGKWLTIIRGGGAVMSPGVGGPLESGPIRIMNENDPHPAIFDGIWFKDWAAEVIFIEASHGFVFRNSKITHPVNRVSPGVRYVHALWSTGVKARGDFIVENNWVEMGGYRDEAPSDDEQLLGIFYSNHDNIRITNNTIIGIDETIEILGNRYGNTGAGDPNAANSPAEIIVTGNRLVSTGQPGEVWPSSFAILICGNLNVDKVIVSNNHITKSGKGWGMGISGENFDISDNTFKFVKDDSGYPAGAITIGGFGKLAIYDMGESFNNSTFTDNNFEGKVTKRAIFFSEGRGKTKNKSHGNTFDLGVSIEALGAETTLFLGKHTYGNTFEGSLGNIVNHSPKGANSY